MADKKWTPAQWDAISTRGGSVLVSAAAGSGKTAVLVERVIGRILDSENPIDADRLLVVTFSNAAALEMKQRILARINAMLAESPEDARLQRQQLLLGRAQISTIHSFCIELIRSNFQRLDISPGVRVADAKELEIIRRDCAGESIERFHTQDESGQFGRLTELLSEGRDDSRVFSTLFSLYDFVRAHPFYNEWLDCKLALYGEGVSAGDSVWGQCILLYALDATDYAQQLIHQAFALMADDDAMETAYRDAFAHDLAQLEELSERLTARDWDGVCAQLAAFTHDKLRPLKGDGGGKEAAQALRADVKEIVKGLRDKQFCATAAEFVDDIAFLRPLVGLLFELMRDFDRTFTALKQSKNCMDFSDMEQYAITLLAVPAGAGYAKTPVAVTVGALYDEVLVDEFQDTNEAQEIIFRAVSSDETNLFMVGDVKQSIYRFRQARPELFLRRKKAYTLYDGTHFPARIILGKNFRSAPAVTGGINFFFSLLMSEKIGEIDYNDEEALIAGASFPDGMNAGCEIALLDVSDYVGERSKSAVEAEQAAERVAAMLERGDLVADGGELRKIRPSDICILLRSPSTKAQLYMDALVARGVPVWAEPKSSFLTTKEIAPVVALLRVLDNPLRDIELAAAMLSVLFGFTAEELAQTRLAARGGALFLAVERRARAGDSHCASLLETLTQLRQYAANATADEVIRKIYALTGCLEKAQVMRMGQARRANLLLLVQYACDYHAGGYKGLTGFVGFLDKLLDRGSDLSPASGLSEQAEVVRIMSIHRSKGLEFPVVLVCDCAKQFNKEDLRGNTLLHSELGFACVRRDFEQMKQFTTVPMQALRLELERSSLSEELRVLYVAMTRAKERLILMGTITKLGERLGGLLTNVDEHGKLPAHPVRGAGSALDWLLMAAAHHPNLAGTLAQFGLEAAEVAAESPLSLTITRVTDDEEASSVAPTRAEALPDPTLLEELSRRLAFVYPYAAQTKIPTKMAISQIAKGEAAQSFRFSRRPSFLSERGLTGAQKGNALHKFMQFSDYARAAQDARAEISRMAMGGFLSQAEADAVSPETLRKFFESPLAARIFAAQTVHRELRFLAEVGAETLGAYTDLFDGTDAKTAIQGVADCVFIEDGEAVIVDYKSDYVKDARELVERYRVQLALYRAVLADSLGVPIKQCVIYSFALSAEITVD